MSQQHSPEPDPPSDREPTDPSGDKAGAQAGPLRVAVIGAGPAGFYTTEALLKGRQDVEVDLFDRLPTPYGLVRFGVAPDHQKIKSVVKLYERALQDGRVRFLGNVSFGRDLAHADLARHYHAVVYSVGSPTDRRLDIPGEDLPGSMSATEFVAWYNGHPDHTDLSVPLDATDVVVIGMGNVAIDVTRVLAKHVDELASTDMADHAIDRLRGSLAERITMVGRRGPAEAKFTTKELRELGELTNADIALAEAELELEPASRRYAKSDATTGKNLEVMAGFAAQPRLGKPRLVTLRFLLSPVEFEGRDRVEAVRFERNLLIEREDGSLSAVGTGEFETIPAQLVLRSVGYRGRPLPEVPFDERGAVIPNQAGRVMTQSAGRVVPGVYVAGWIKRGPSGVIGTNKADAMETVASLLDDAARGSLPALDPVMARAEAVDALLRERGCTPFGLGHWARLDKAELARGESQGRPRVKAVTVMQMLEWAGSSDERD